MTTFPKGHNTQAPGLSGHTPLNTARAIPAGQPNSGTATPHTFTAQELRGIPVLAKGVNSAIPGTQP